MQDIAQIVTAVCATLGLILGLGIAVLHYMPGNQRRK